MNVRLVLRLASTLLLTLCLTSTEAQVTVITAGQLVDPEEGTVLANQTVVIENGIIQEVGEDLTIPDGARHLDLSSLTVLPGLMDAHTHVASAYDADNSPDSDWGSLLEYNVEVSTAARSIQGFLAAQSYLDAGFTTIRDLGNAGDFADSAILNVLSAEPIANTGQVKAYADPRPGQIGSVPGPTFFISGKILAPFGGQMRVSANSPEVALIDFFEADTRDEIRKAIRQNIHYGASWIKIIVDDQGFRPYMYSVEDIKFIIEEAGRAGVKVAAHSLVEEGARVAIEAGVASLEHGYEMSDELLELAKERGVVLVGCELGPGPDSHNALHHPGEIERIQDRLERAYRIGVELVFAADILRQTPGFTKGQLAIGAIDTWKAAGIPAADILRAMTTNSARLLGIADQRGGIRPGMAADFIGTTGNPLDDIAVLKQVSFVMKDGVVFRRD